MKKIIVLLFIVACSSSQNNSLENKYDKTIAIPQKEMISIFRDYHLADGVNSMKNMREIMTLCKGDTIKFLDSILVSHGYNKQQFDTTVRIYVQDLQYFSYLYDNVIKELSKMEGEINKKDSL